jgi:hypothetical protein
VFNSSLVVSFVHTLLAKRDVIMRMESIAGILLETSQPNCCPRRCKAVEVQGRTVIICRHAQGAATDHFGIRVWTATAGMVYMISYGQHGYNNVHSNARHVRSPPAKCLTAAGCPDRLGGVAARTRAQSSARPQQPRLEQHSAGEVTSAIHE